MKKLTKAIINKVSSFDYEIKKVYQIQRKIQEFGGILVSKKAYVDSWILTKNGNIAIRIFFPLEETEEAIIFYHGGGWVIGNLNYYNKTCYELAIKTGKYVISVNYRLAPEFPYPAAFDDCYEVTKYFFNKDNFLNLKAKNITIMGDSAGGCLAATISLYARDTKDFKVEQQILIYPLTYYDHSENSPFNSVLENGEDWILTTKKLNEYMKMYVKDDKYLTSPYLTPLSTTNYKKQPKTLIITAQYDPLRDEGEAYGVKLSQYNEVTMHRINDVIHGFFCVPITSKETEICYNFIIEFLKGDKNEA